MNNGNNKNERLERAKAWLKVLLNYKDAIKHTISRSHIVTDFYSTDLSPFDKKVEHTACTVYKQDVAICTKAALTRSKGAKVLVLNFASYYNPGGGFLKGAMAQEEAICHVSTLYPVLRSFGKDFYDEHRNHENDGTYSDNHIYSEDVTFIINGKSYLADVITIAAPNAKAAMEKSKHMSWDILEDVMYNRLEQIFLAAIHHNVDILIGGAFGCGVFGNDATFVANCWKRLMEKYDGYIPTIAHAVLDADMAKVFDEVILGKKSTNKGNKKKKHK